MGRHSKYINEHFFDRNDEISYYVLGCFYACYVPRHKQGIIFRSKRKDLVTIVHNLIGSEHTIVKIPNKKSYSFEARKVPCLRQKLKEMGLEEDKERRTFPKIEDDELVRYFVRGFVEGTGYVKQDNENTKLYVKFNHEFLNGLSSTLSDLVGLSSKQPKNKKICYYNNECFVLSGYLYPINCNIPYLAEFREMLKNVKPKEHIPKTHIESRERIMKAIMLIEKGMSVNEVCHEIGYKCRISLYRAFKKITGKTLREYFGHDFYNRLRKA